MLRAASESPIPQSLLGSFCTGRNFLFSLFHFRPLGMWFHTINPPPNSRHPWNINISTSQSIFILKHMPNAACGCEDTWLLFIHLIYLYFFPEGETLVSIHLRWLLAITEHLEPLLNGPAGNVVLERSPRFRAKRCVCFVYFFRRVADLEQERYQIHVVTSKKLVCLLPAAVWLLFWSYK